MGSTYSLICLNCGYELELLWGTGMFFPTPENLPDMVPEADRERVQQLLAREDRGKVQISRELFSCPDCHLPASYLNWRIETGDGEVHQPEYFCEACRARLEPSDSEQFQLPTSCPVCGSEQVLRGSGDWD